MRTAYSVQIGVPIHDCLTTDMDPRELPPEEYISAFLGCLERFYAAEISDSILAARDAGKHYALTVK